MRIRYIDLFAGIGGFRLAARQAFDRCGLKAQCLFSCEIDPHAKAMYKANFGQDPYGDIFDLTAEDIPDHDILFAGFPCQPFSIIGKGKGFEDTRGTLFFEIARILRDKKPKAFILENVRRLVSHEGGYTLRKILDTLTQLGYSVDYKILNALDFGLPQKRERVFIVGSLEPLKFIWPKRMMEPAPLNEILDTDVDKKYMASDWIVNKRKSKHRSQYALAIWHENKSGAVSSHPYSCALRASASHNYLLVNGERRLTPKEMLKLQGFPDTFKIVAPYGQIKKQAGNAVPVNVARAVIEALIPSFMPALREQAVC